MVCLLELPIARLSDHRKVERREQMHPQVEEEHRREVPSWMMMKSTAMARALGMKVQREVEFFRCSSSSEQAPREGLKAYASGIDATMVTGCREDPKTYEDVGCVP